MVEGVLLISKAVVQIPIGPTDVVNCIYVRMKDSCALFITNADNGGAGASASIGIGQEYFTENHGRVCIEVQTCGRIGPGAAIGAAVFGGVGEGSFCEGNNASGGVFAEGGLGAFEGVEASHGTDGSGAAASIKSGIGGGGAIGSQACVRRTFCFP